MDLHSKLMDWFLYDRALCHERVKGCIIRSIEEQMDRAFKFALEHDTYQQKMQNGIPLVVAYNLVFRDLSTILRKKL